MACAEQALGYVCGVRMGIITLTTSVAMSQLQSLDLQNLKSMVETIGTLNIKLPQGACVSAFICFCSPTY